MAEFDYYATWDESFTMLQALLADEGIRAYPEMVYEQPVARQLDTLTDDWKDYLRTWRRLYLFGPFSTHPPLFTQRQGGVHAGKWFLREQGGGPLVTLSLAGEYVIDGQLTLTGGDLTTQPHYELEPDRWERATSAVREGYAALRRVMMRHLKRYRGAIWIGPEALQLYESGRARFIAVGTIQALAKVRGAPSSSSTPPAASLPNAAAGE